jgi:ABC-type transport system involved in cytochrome bd biosynthesis fused ATPase/permease subunit
MIDQGLLKLLGKDMKYIYLTVLFMLLGLLGNIMITFCLCLSIYLASTNQSFMGCFMVAGVVMLIRYMTSILAGDLREVLGRNVRKNLREQVYQKMIKLGVKSTNDMSMAGLTQVAMGIKGIMTGCIALSIIWVFHVVYFFFGVKTI